MNYDVSRYAILDPLTGDMGGDFLRVGDRELGDVRIAGDLEYLRAKRDNPSNPAFHMRRMFFTGSPYGKEILELFDEVNKQ
jgi:hypothetical protein